MDNLTELKALWHTASTNQLPDATEMIKLIKQFRSQRLTKKWTIIISASSLAALIILVLFITDFKMVITYVGGILIAASALFYAINNVLSLKRFYQLEDCSNKEFLEFVEQTRLNQIYYYKKTQKIIMVLCTVGLLLYLYEPATQHFIYTLILFLVTIICLLFSWFVLRPRSFNKNQQKLHELSEHLKNISNQLKQYEK
jgi:O-antigen/teichoic acid export membrane protein